MSMSLTALSVTLAAIAIVLAFVALVILVVRQGLVPSPFPHTYSGVLTDFYLHSAARSSSLFFRDGSQKTLMLTSPILLYLVSFSRLSS